MNERDEATVQIRALAMAQRDVPDSRVVIQPDDFYARYYGPQGATFVARDGDEVVGFGLLGMGLRINRIWQPYIAAMGTDAAKCAVLVQVLVRVAYRGCGIGRKLVHARIEHAAARGCRRLFSTVDLDNGPCSLARALASGAREAPVSPVAPPSR